jgi:hypothetical protein
MSKHNISCTNTQGNTRHLEVGYDRPLDAFFLNILNSSGDMVYTSIAETDMNLDSERLATKLAEHGVAIPHQLICQLAMEAMFGGSNAFTDHGEFKITTLDETLLKAGFFQHMPSYLPAPEESQWVWRSIKDVDTEYVNLSSKTVSIAFPRYLCQSHQMDEMLKQPEKCKTPEELQEVATLILVVLNDGLYREPGKQLCDVLERLIGFAPCSVGFAEPIETI